MTLLLYKISKQVVFTLSCSSVYKHQDACPQGIFRISVTQRTGDAGHWVLPVSPVFLLLGDDELVFWTDLVCLFRVVFCSYVPAGLTESNSTLVSSANTASVLGPIRPGLGGAQLD